MSSELPVLDRSVLMESLGNDKELIKEILELFKDTTPEIVENLDNAANEGNIEEVKRNAHSLKGSAGNIGAKALEESMRNIEAACAKNELEGIRNKVSGAIGEYNLLKSELDSQ
ncbi:MAG: Hpt domain-containing protein [Candidatus Aegiribacteria sp.]|nr:Hpt domain-containing protein [Candidatus Aegiribacteria sp.]